MLEEQEAKVQPRSLDSTWYLNTLFAKQNLVCDILNFYNVDINEKQ